MISLADIEEVFCNKDTLQFFARLPGTLVGLISALPSMYDLEQTAEAKAEESQLKDAREIIHQVAAEVSQAVPHEESEGEFLDDKFRQAKQQIKILQKSTP